jgi:hypothetical protein
MPSAAIPTVFLLFRSIGAFLNPDRHFSQYKSTKYQSELFSKMAIISPHSFKIPHQVIHRFYQLVCKLLEAWEKQYYVIFFTVFSCFFWESDFCRSLQQLQDLRD